MLVRGCDDGTAPAAGFVSAPTDVVLLFAHLNLSLVPMPGTDLPNRSVLGQLFLYKRDMAGVVRSFRDRPDARKDEKQAPIGTSRPYTEVTNAMRAIGFVQPVRQLSLVAVGIIKAPDVVIPDARELGKFVAKSIRDHSVPGARVISIIEIALMEHQIGTLGLDQLQNGAGPVAYALVPDNRHGQWL